MLSSLLVPLCWPVLSGRSRLRSPSAAEAIASVASPAISLDVHLCLRFHSLFLYFFSCSLAVLARVVRRLFELVRPTALACTCTCSDPQQDRVNRGRSPAHSGGDVLMRSSSPVLSRPRGIGWLRGRHGSRCFVNIYWRAVLGQLSWFHSCRALQ